VHRSVTANVCLTVVNRRVQTVGTWSRSCAVCVAYARTRAGDGAGSSVGRIHCVGGLILLPCDFVHLYRAVLQWYADSKATSAGWSKCSKRWISAFEN
jgi:hypothetical protein